MKQYFIKTGFWDTFKIGRKAPGLHLNKVIRDVLRSCGIPCPNCIDDGCNEPLSKLLTATPITYLNSAGEKMEALSLSLPRYADDATAIADGFPTNGTYINTTTGALTVLL